MCDTVYSSAMNDLAAMEKELLLGLQAKVGTNPNGVLKRTPRQFVLDYGWFYKPEPLPPGIVVANEGECFNNALQLALANPNLIYVEGYALGGYPIAHAWVTDGSGRVFDNTWATLGLAYAGVPFKTSWVSLIGLKNKGIGSLIDDWEHGWPLCGELGDTPKFWLESKGKGTRELITASM
jgi:hypothetical protein